MKNEVSAPRRWFTQRLEKYENSQLLFLDINVWINLVESPRDEWRTARQHLIELRRDHKILCPVAAPLLWELYKQTYSSARGVALLMDQLSARTTLRQVDELYRSDVATLFEQLTGRPHPPAHRHELLAPTFAYLASRWSIDFPDDPAWTSERREEFLTITGAITSFLGVQDLLHHRKDDLPQPERNQKVFSSGQFQSSYISRREISRADKEVAWLIEAAAIYQRFVEPELSRLRRSSTPLEVLREVQTVNSLPEGKQRSRLPALLEKIPALHARADLAWAAGLDTNRKDRPGDFYDLELLKHALPYCDVFVTQDRWIKHLLCRATPQTLDRAGTTFLASPDELNSFLVSLY